MKIFSYGTLSDKNIQLKEFNMEFKIEKKSEVVEGYKIKNIVIEKESYKIAIPSKNKSIKGCVIDVPDEIISSIDKWEGESYNRIKVKTKSGIDCMMYIIK